MGLMFGGVRKELVSVCGVVCMVLSAHAITPNTQESQLAGLIETDPGQQRPAMTFHPVLNMVARFHARDMANRSYFGHWDPDGYGPNYRVRLAELELPFYYGQEKGDKDEIESLAVGSATAQAAFNLWMISSVDKAHVLGETQSYADQTYYGVGYHYDAGSLFNHYWVFVSTPPDTAASLAVYIEWMFDRMTTAQIDDCEDDPDNDSIKTLLEYVVDYDPVVANPSNCFTFAYNPTNYDGEVTLPIRPDLDPDVGVYVQTTTNLAVGGWSTNGVQRTGNTFSAGDPADAGRFFRIYILRDPP